MGLPPGVTLVPMPQSAPPTSPSPVATAPSGPPPGVSLIPMPQASASSSPAAPAAPPANDLTANPNAEGVYGMQGTKGESVQVPYSKVPAARQQGYQLQGGSNWYGAPQGDAGRYARDYAADPNQIRVTKQFSDAVQDDAQRIQIGAIKQGERTVGGLMKILGDNRDQSSAALRSVGIPGQSAPPATAAPDPISDHMRKGAAWLNQNTDADGFFEHLGGFGENVAELLTPEALGVLAKSSEAVKGGEAADQAVTAAQKYSDAAKVAQTLEKFPRIRDLVGIGLAAAAKAGAEVGGQTYVKTGGDEDAALHAGEIGAGIGGVLAPVLEAGGVVARNYVRNNQTAMEDVGGVPTPVSAEVRNARPTPEQAAGQQSIQNAAQSTLAQRLEEVNESRAVPENTQLALPARTGPFTFELHGPSAEMTSEGDSLLAPARARQIGTRVVAGKGSGTAATEPVHISAFTHPGVGDEAPLAQVSDLGEQPEGSHKEPVLQYLSGSKPGTPAPKTDVLGGGGVLRTQDPNVAVANVRSLNEAIDSPEFDSMPAEQQQALLDARSNVQQQLSQYHAEVRQNLPGAGKPNFPQIDVRKTIQGVGSYTEAADHLEGIATDGYNNIADSLALNDISGGKFNQIRNANKEAWKAYKGATTGDGMRAAEQTIDVTNQQMQSLLQNDIGGSVSPKELAGFNDAYGQAQKLRYVANAVDRAFSGNGSEAARSWEYRGFNGQMLMGNLDRLVTKFGRNTLDRVVGSDNMNTLYQVAELNRTGAARAKFGAAVKAVADSPAMRVGAHFGAAAVGGALGHTAGIGYGLGAAAGEGTMLASMATKRVMDTVLSNPRIAQNLIFAIKSGARESNYAPLIGGMITQLETERAKQQDQGGQNQ